MRLFRRDHTRDGDEALMRLIARGDEQAFTVLYERHGRALFRYFHRMLWKDKEKAEDFVQDFFMKIIRNPGQYDPSRRFVTWMYSVAHNMCKNEYRKQELRKPASFGIAEETIAGDSGAQAEKRVDRKAFLRLLFDELEQLDEDHRTTFLLRYEEEFSIKEISRVLDCSEGTVKSRLFYTLRKLSVRLKDYAPEHLKNERA